MSRFVTFCVSLVLFGVGSSLCVAACGHGCVELTASGHAEWRTDHWHKYCRRYAGLTSLGSTRADPITGGSVEDCEQTVQYRGGCTQCTVQCEQGPPPIPRFLRPGPLPATMSTHTP